MSSARRLATAVAVVLLIAGCSGGKYVSPTPSTKQAVAVFNGDLAAAQHHDEAGLCATADYGPDQCHQELQHAGGWPKLNNVRYTSIRVVDQARVLYVCGVANGQPFAGDFPVVLDDSPHAINPLFWKPIHFLHNPGNGAFKAGASAGPEPSAPPLAC